LNITATHDSPASQHLRALERANCVRIARAELKRRVTRGELDVRQVILRCPSEACTMSVDHLLMSQPRWGANRSRKVLAALCLSDRKTIGSLTERQRGALVALLAPARRIVPAHQRDERADGISQT
jgi:hypothetical protein